jgi:hypothetical protein
MLVLLMLAGCNVKGRMVSSGMMFLPSFMNIHKLVPELLKER